MPTDGSGNKSWEWRYPYNAAMTRAVGFAIEDQGSLSSDDSHNWRPPLADQEISGDAVQQTVDGQSRAYRTRQTGRRIELLFESFPEGSAASATDLYGRAGVRDFLINGCNFSQEFFEFYPDTPEAEPGVKVRYIGGFGGWVKSNGLWRGSIILQREDS